MDKIKIFFQKNLKYFLIFFVVVFLNSCSVFKIKTDDTTYGNLYGSIVDSTYFLPIENASITLTGSLTTTTTPNGTFEIKDIPTGTLTFVIKAESCEKLDASLKCGSGTKNFKYYLKNLVLQKGDNILDTIILSNAASFTTPASIAGSFSSPRGIASDSSDNFYIADTKNHQIQKFNSTGGFVDKLGTEGKDNGQFESPYDVAVDNSGNIFVADTYNHRIQKCTSFSASSCTLFFGTTGTSGNTDALLNLPSGVFVNAQGILFVADTFNHRILALSASSKTLLFKIGGTKGSGNYEFNYPSDITTDTNGNIYVADNWNHRIQKFSSSGIYLESYGSRGATPGFFNNPYSLAFDKNGKLYISDYGNNEIQVYTFSANNYSADVLTLTSNPLGIVVLSTDDIIFSNFAGEILKSQRQ